ncbi:hypothetical protein ACLB6G_04890 [Zhengella sp. ZM62]|uniref:hypothetical protein n=1 Tax=Zhengella sedimenti TaxID=3390035 RepID=UPI003975E6D7
MKLQPGDIVEIDTDAGHAYVQVTHDHPSYPEVVRALPGLHRKRPADLAALAAAPGGFTAMLPLGAALEQGRIAGRRIGAAPVPAPFRPFPTFRMPVRDRQGNVAYWWLWDGEGLRHVGELEEAQSGLPMREVMTAQAFLARLG